MMKGLVIVAVCLAAVNSLTLEDQWSNFKGTFGKEYKTLGEEQSRLSIFQDNLRKIAEHNEKYEEGLSTYQLGVNQFADMTPAEFQERLGLNFKLQKSTSCEAFTPSNVNVPDSMDWRQKGAVTEVKDQGACGSCWSFSATGSLEGQNFLKNGKLVSFSEQNLVDCAGEYGNYGCGGGLMDSAFEYIADHGIDTESEYPYTAMNGVCHHVDGHGLEIKSCMDIKSGSEDDLQTAVATVGPTAVGIAATNNFQLYAGGILNDDSCVHASLNHGVLVVGYGTENGVDYWIVKNSWGNAWGESGYVRMSRNANNQCGIASQASYPVV